MNTLNWQDPWFVTAIWLGFGFPLLVIVLEELIQQLKRRQNPLASTFQQVKNFLLPTSILLVFVQDVFKIDRHGALSKVLETLCWISAIFIALSLIDVLLFEQAEKGSWQSRIPKVSINICRFLSLAIGGIFVLSRVWGVNLAGLGTALVIIFLVIGLALKDPLSGILTGIMLVFERPFTVGDWLSVGDVEGQVIEMNWRTVRLLTPSRKMLILPYQVIGQQAVCNHTASSNFFSTTIKLSFSCENPPNLVKRVLISTALSVRGILKTPPPQCTTLSYEGSEIDYELEFYVSDFQAVKSVRGEFFSHLWYSSRRNNLVLYHYNYSYQVELPNNTGENSKNKLRQYFSSIPAFIPLAKEQRQIDDLAKGTNIRSFGAGEQIVSQGDRVDALYIVITGSAIMTVQVDDNKELKVLTLSPGEFFGVQALFTREPCSVSFTALEDMEVMKISEDAFNAMLARQPSLSREMAKVIDVRQNAIDIAIRTHKQH